MPAAKGTPLGPKAPIYTCSMQLNPYITSWGKVLTYEKKMMCIFHTFCCCFIFLFHLESLVFLEQSSSSDWIISHSITDDQTLTETWTIISFFCKNSADQYTGQVSSAKHTHLWAFEWLGMFHMQDFWVVTPKFSTPSPEPCLFIQTLKYILRS